MADHQDGGHQSDMLRANARRAVAITGMLGCVAFIAPAAVDRRSLGQSPKANPP
jgi:hypothetical protein